MKLKTYLGHSFASPVDYMLMIRLGAPVKYVFGEMFSNINVNILCHFQHQHWTEAWNWHWGLIRSSWNLVTLILGQCPPSVFIVIGMVVNYQNIPGDNETSDSPWCLYIRPPTHFFDPYTKKVNLDAAQQLRQRISPQCVTWKTDRIIIEKRWSPVGNWSRVCKKQFFKALCLIKRKCESLWRASGRQRMAGGKPSLSLTLSSPR